MRTKFDEKYSPTLFPTELPTVSVVVVNYNGKEFLEPCLESVVSQSYEAEKVEIILIDNASVDGSIEMVKKKFPEVRIVVNEDNVGFSPAVNQAARIANGEVLALLNNDAVADGNWLMSGVTYLQSHHDAACVGSLILGEDRKTIDYAGSAMAFNGMGYAKHNSHKVTDQRLVAGPTLFASGGAMLVLTDMFLSSGGFDESYFAFFEDVDFGWRLWVMGYETHFVPQSKVYHRHHGTISRFGYARERYLLERNALATIFKNYGDDLLAKALPSSLMLALMRGFTDLEDDCEGLPDFAITDGAKNIDGETYDISALTAAHLAAIRSFTENIELYTAKRVSVQAARGKKDSEILPMFKEALLANVRGPEYLNVWQSILDVFELEKAFTQQTRILILTGDVLSEKMAGPAIRCFEMATVLSDAGFDVTLASTKETTLTNPKFKVTWTGIFGGITAMVQETDIIIFQGFVMNENPIVSSFSGPVIADIYDPFHIEGITQRKFEMDHIRQVTATGDADVLNRQLERGDFFLCASEKQRDFWLGQMSAVKRINPSTFDEDESLRSLIDVVPFGIPSGDPVRTEQRVLRGVVDGIDEDSFVLVWGGGIYNWFDPLTLIEAVAETAKTHPNIKLWFMGNAHPNPSVPKMQMAADSYNLAVELGVLDKHVFFNEGWVDYDERQNYLTEADIGVSTHFEHLETRYSFRTRILDYIWCTLPILATEGDTLSDLVRERGLGVTVPPEDVEAIVEGLRQLMDDQAFYDSCRENLNGLRPGMTWERCMEPLVEFCRNPRRSPDADPAVKTLISGEYKWDQIRREHSMIYYVQKFGQSMVADGPTETMKKVRNVVRAMIS